MPVPQQRGSSGRFKKNNEYVNMPILHQQLQMEEEKTRQQQHQQQYEQLQQQQGTAKKMQFKG